MRMTKSAEAKNRSNSSALNQFTSGGEILSQKNMDILEEFILSSPAPLEIAAKLSRAFYLSSNREKEQSKRLLDCAAYCESLAVELLEICRCKILFWLPENK